MAFGRKNLPVPPGVELPPGHAKKTKDNWHLLLRGLSDEYIVAGVIAIIVMGWALYALPKMNEPDEFDQAMSAVKMNLIDPIVLNSMISR